MGAVSCWPLDENTGTSVGDSVGSNTGTLTNASGWSTTVAPVAFSPNDASLFGNHLYYALLANAATIGPAASYSFSMWIRWDSLPGDRDAAFGLEAVFGGFSLAIGSSLDGDSKVAFDLGLAGLAYQSCKSAATIVAGNWYHVAVVLRNGSADLYVNGSYEATCTYDANTLAATDSTGGMIIGAEGYDAGMGGGMVYQFNLAGYVDDVRTFDHELTGGEITALAARTSSGAPLVALSASTNSIAENGGTTSIIALMDATASATVTVVVGVSGDASSGSDYTLSTDTITIASGSTSGSLTITAIDDAAYEGNETFTASIASVTGGGAIASSTASTSVVTIIDDESQPVVNFSVSSTTLAENGGVVYLAALLSNVSFQDIQVGVGFDGTATINTDYTKTAILISVPHGSTSGSISITAINDSIDEKNETIILTMGSVINGVAGTATSVTLTITDDDPLPAIRMSASSTTIAENGGSSILTVYTDAVSGRDITGIVAAGGSATAGVDYNFSNGGSFSIVAGQTSTTISLTSVADTLFESTETVICAFFNLTNTQVATSGINVTVNITNEYLAPFVSLTASTTSISENGGSATVYAILDHTHTQNVTIVFALTGSATLNTDYSTTTTSIVISTGSSSGSMSITAINDSAIEGNETVLVSLSSVTNGTASSTASNTTVTLVDDDAPPGSGLTGLSALSGLSGIH